MDPCNTIVEALQIKAEFYHLLANLVLVAAVPIGLYLYVALKRWNQHVSNH